jgi:hypothetical protein
VLVRPDNSTTASDKRKLAAKVVSGPTKAFKPLIRMGFIVPPNWAICLAAFEIAAFEPL